MAANRKRSHAPASSSRAEPDHVEVDAFGHHFRVLRGLGENLITLEKEGAIYSHLWNEQSQTFRYCRIKLLPRELFEYVEAHVAQQQFASARLNGATFDDALDAIIDPRIRQRVLSYGNYGKTALRDGTELDIRGCAASFYPPEIEALVCGRRPERYELLPSLDNADATGMLIRMIDNFRVSARSLFERAHKRPPFKIENEYDVQDVLFSCVRAGFNDARREEWTPQHAGTAKRIDIVVPSASTLIEVKFVRSGPHAKTVADELKVDIESYHAHAACKTILVLVYDPNVRIADPTAIEQDLSGRRMKGSSSFDVQVMVRR